jgi:hypothetical protein
VFTSLSLTIINEVILVNQKRKEELSGIIGSELRDAITKIIKHIEYQLSARAQNGVNKNFEKGLGVAYNVLRFKLVSECLNFYGIYLKYLSSTLIKEDSLRNYEESYLLPIKSILTYNPLDPVLLFGICRFFKIILQEKIIVNDP